MGISLWRFCSGRGKYHLGRDDVIDRRDTYTVGRSSRVQFPVNLDLVLLV